MEIEAAISGALAEAREAGTLDPVDTGEAGDFVEPISDEVVDDVDGDGEGAAAVVEGEKPAIPPVVELPKADPPKPDDPLAKDLGDSHDKKGRENRIPHSRVQVIAKNAETRGEAKAKAAFEPQLAERDTKIATLEPIVEKFGTLENIMFDEPARMVEILRRLPGYDTILGAPGATSVPAASVANADDPMPEPDYDLGNGQKTYSVKGLAKWQEWTTAKVIKQVTSELDKRVKPFEDEKKTREQMEQSDNQNRAELNAVAQLPGFGDIENDVLVALRADTAEAVRTKSRPKLSLRDAYWQVRLKKAEEKGNPDTIRAQIIAEMNGAATGTGTGRTPQKPGAIKEEDLSTEDVIRRSLRAAKL